MSAMMAFMAAKAEYDALPPDAPRDALHEKHAKTALEFALAHRGVYIKAGQFIASLQGGASGGSASYSAFAAMNAIIADICLLYTSPSPRDS